MWEEFSYAEAADVLAIPVGTVKSRLASARRKMRELFPFSGHEGEGSSSEGIARSN